MVIVGVFTGRLEAVLGISQKGVGYCKYVLSSPLWYDFDDRIIKMPAFRHFVLFETNTSILIPHNLETLQEWSNLSNMLL